MVKRFASHYLYLTAYGFLKQYIVEINNDGYVGSLSPLEEEIESIVWSPGVIALVPRHLWGEKKHGEADAHQRHEILNALAESESLEIKQELPETYKNDMAQLQLIAVRLYPFDFISMQPVADTSIQLLDKHAL